MTTLRCLREVELELHPRRNYIFGPNGAGKTSLLEGIYVLGRGRSFRTRQIQRLVQRGSESFAVFGEVLVGGSHRRLGVAYGAGRLEKKIDGQAASGMAELAELLPVHAIDPSMHALVEGGPSERRRFVDWGVFHVEPQYLDAWKRYRRVLSQRNAALKRGATLPELRSWSSALLDAGVAVDDSRARYLSRLAPRVSEFGERLLGRPLTIEYRRGWAGGTSFEEALRLSEPRDRQTGRTEPGPHRAEVLLQLSEQRVQDEASRGQQKLTAAALILAQVAVETLDRPPRSVLVVDDPAAELDRSSLQRLLEVIDDLPAQQIFTALSPEYLPPQPEHPVFHVERGEVRAI